MVRRETSDSRCELIHEMGRCTAAAGPRFAWALTGSILASLIGASFALAEPATLPDVSSPPPPPAAIDFSAPDAAGDPDALIPPVPEAPPAAEPIRTDLGRIDLRELLFVPGARRDSWRPRTADERIAVAVQAGTNPELEPKNPFRKKNRDLFRTERPVTIWRQEMLMRLRLRAKAKRAVSLEFHY